MVLSAVQNVMGLLIMIAVGFWLAGKPWFGKEGSGIFSKFAVKVAIPCYLAYNIYVTFDDRAGLLEVFSKLPYSFLMLLTALALGSVVCRVLKVAPRRRGVFTNAFTFGNTVLVGFPVVEALFGAEASACAMVYYMANCILFWSVGVYLLRVDGGGKAKFFSWDNLKKIFSPAICAVMVGVCLVLLDVTLPQFLFMPLQNLGRACTPVAMVFIGCIIRQADLAAMDLSRDLVAVLLSRFILSPLMTFALCLVIPADPLLKRVFLVLSVMPAMTQMGIMAKECGSDYEFASVLVAITSIISMVLLPVFVFIMEHFHIFPLA